MEPCRWTRAARSVGSIGGLLVGVGLATMIALTALVAEAKATYQSPYDYGRTWTAALRLVRVDNGWKVTEKDDASGYILFEYRSPESSKPCPGSLELVRGPEADAPVSVLAQLPQMPHYHEQVLLDALASKMRREYGDPPPVRRKPATPDPDGGPDAPGN
jgi:hypothetical protein